MKLMGLFIVIAVLLAGHSVVAQDEHSPNIKPSFTSQVGEEVRNLDQVGVGDIVYVHHTESAVATAIVEAINLEANTFRLREPDGEIREYTARNPDNLRRAEVGDKVVATVTTSVAITVDKQPKE